MTDAHAKAIRNVAASVPTLRTGTVVTDYADPNTATYVALDNDPTSTPVRALTGQYLAAGTRVLLASYPPRGLAIIEVLGGIRDPRTLRPVDSEGGNIGPTTNSAVFVNLGVTSTDVTLPYSPSGILKVTFGGAIQINDAAINTFGIVSFEIRDTNAAGTVRLAASDDRCFLVSRPPIAQFASMERTYVATGMPTTGTAFVRPMFRVAGTVNFMTLARPYCIVQPVA